MDPSMFSVAREYPYSWPDPRFRHFAGLYDHVPPTLIRRSMPIPGISSASSVTPAPYQLRSCNHDLLEIKWERSRKMNVSRDLDLISLKTVHIPAGSNADRRYYSLSGLDVPAASLYPRIKDRKKQLSHPHYGKPSDFTVEFVFETRINEGSDAWQCRKAALRRKGTNQISLISTTNARNPEVNKRLSTHDPLWVAYGVHVSGPPCFWNALKELPLL
jgi:hypothetical protein